MQNTYKAYIFDFDYTLVDSSPGIITCFRHVLTLHNHHNITDHDIRRTIGHTLEHSFTILTGITNPQTLATYKQQYTTHADTCMTKLTQFFPETVNVLQQLHNRGALLGIVSTKYRYRIQEMLRTNNQPHLADFIIGGEDVTHPKPNPEGLLLAKKYTQCNPQQILYVGDSIPDAQAAHQANLPFAAVLHGMTTQQELQQFPHTKIMNNLTELL